MAICILVHHLYQHSGIFRAGWLRHLGTGCQALGFLSTAVFFFLSGYGLLASYSANPESISKFGKMKIVPFYIIDVLLVAIYSLEALFLLGGIAVPMIIKSLTFGGTIIVSGWYIQVQLLYYIMFFVVFLFKKNRSWLPFMLVLHTAYLIVGVISGLSSLYYERTYIFVFGMLWYENREKIDCYLRSGRRCVSTWLALFVLFVGNYVASFFVIPPLFRGISYFFVIPVLLISLTRINIQNKITHLLGKISFEIYVMHGIFLTLFHSQKIYIDNPYLYILAVLVSTFIAALMIYPVIKGIYRVFREKK